MELEARRQKRGEKRPLSPDIQDPSVVDLSDESNNPDNSDDNKSKSGE